MEKMSKRMQLEIGSVLRQAEDYASASLRSVLPRLRDDSEHPNHLYRRFTQLMLGLEVHFLFPNLSATQQRLLADLVQARTALAVRRETGPRRLGRGRTMSLEAWEKRVSGLKERARALEGSEDLTPLQQELLERVFLSVQ